MESAEQLLHAPFVGMDIDPAGGSIQAAAPLSCLPGPSASVPFGERSGPQPQEVGPPQDVFWNIRVFHPANSAVRSIMRWLREHSEQGLQPANCDACPFRSHKLWITRQNGALQDRGSRSRETIGVAHASSCLQ
jgi:hypothetical protein